MHAIPPTSPLHEIHGTDMRTALGITSTAIAAVLIGAGTNPPLRAEPSSPPAADGGVPDAGVSWHSDLRIPESLLDDPRMRAEAINCAERIGSAASWKDRCDQWNGVAKGLEAATAAAAIGSTAMATQVSSGAKSHWTWAAIGFGAAFGMVKTFDDWLNCADRTFKQQALYADRLAHLQNAGHLMACAHEREEQQAPGDQGSSDAGPVRSRSGTGTTTAVQDTDVRDVYVLPTPCLEVPVDGGVPVMPSAARLRDRAHEQLILCTRTSPAKYGAFTAAPPGSP